MNHLTRSARVLSAITLAGLTACGGSGTNSSTGASSVTAFPTGVSVGSPTELGSSSGVVTAMNLSPAHVWRDWAIAGYEALKTGDWHTLQHLATVALPLGAARADADKVPEAKITASEIEAVATGRRTLSQIGLSLNHLFAQNANNASCFGPSIDYSAHENGTPASGTLPTGDLGIWLATDADSGQPCAAAQLTARLTKVKRQTRQGMLLMAAVRRLVATSSELSMPTAGNQTDVTSALGSALSSLLSGASIGSATIALNGGGTIYTYRLVLSRGSGASAESAEIIVQHTPGASTTQFSGVMSIAISQLSGDAAFGCNDEVSNISGTNYYKAASVSTLRYTRDGNDISFSSRSGQYCGAPTGGSSNHRAELAAVDSNGELDPSVQLSGNTRSGGLGWVGNFSRFAGDMDKDTQAGDFLYVWQAGTGDSHGRAFAVHSAYNSSTEARALDAYFGYADEIGGTPSSILGMICNWAGPGSSHTPADLFQRQSMSLASSATNWTLGTSKITYAPTNACSSTTTQYDINDDNTISSGEGVGVSHDLDSKGGSASVQAELISRGYTVPSLF